MSYYARATRVLIQFALVVCICVGALSLHASRAEIGGTGPMLSLAGYHVTFADDFKTLSLSAHGPGTVWSAHTPWNGDFSDAAFSDPNPAVFQITPQGLSIIASKGPDGKWRSGLISSAYKDNDPNAGFSQQFGYFEMTAKLPSGMGTWPAFWLIGTDKHKFADEIDVIEYYGGFPTYFHTTEHVWSHGQNTFLRTTMPEIPKGLLSQGFNSFGVQITPETTTFYLNRHQFWSTPTPPEYHQPLYMLADLALGGGWPTSGLRPPIVMQIRQIKVWQRDEPWSP